ncbi:pentapeptide repeat-containing protein [Oculatella sp. FACHB-28]|uniref:pentapeptide repeat-containing protein n=1 Tax=Oculatella sp. FACHB-28 TaxID=2692845 RepID=UPI0016867557|nr:pentapeptide repeat-containing protein [Oculatella sp. FACHB-28]MBD2056125.1 pentapeptide repeat-containing protein [Oculatella sp. FACHB-28]
MTDNDYLSLIQQGVEAWNRWRGENPEVKPDLSRAYLFEADLSGFDLSHVNFSRVCLIGANLKRANLSGAELDGAYASGANLSEANLSGANLRSANLSEANLNGADLTSAQLEATDLTAAQLTGACLENWRISRTTKLHKVESRYVYLDRQQKRCPLEGDFKPGELAAMLQAESDRSPIQPSPTPSPPPKHKQVPPVWISPQVPGVESKPAPVESPPEKPTEVAALQPVATPGRSRSIPWEILVGVGVGLAVIAAIASFPRTRTVTELPPLVCNEPPLPSLFDRAPDHEYEDGTRFYGSFSNTAPLDGRGSMMYPNGDRYDGEFRDGKRNGCGTFTFENGRNYVGQFRDDQFQGQGIWTLENGDRYIGEFQANKCNGQGTFISVDGSQKTGIWENGDLAGDNLSCDRSPLRLPGSPE